MRTEHGVANAGRRLFTSESVTEGHPDKMCDAISDSILDALLEQDRLSRVAVETMVTTGQVHVAGEVTTSGYVDIPGLVRDRILEIGYDSSAKGFDGALVRGERGDRGAVARHRPGRRHRLREPGRVGGRRDRPPGCRRPGPDVRLREHRHPRAAPAADRAGPPPGPAADRGAQAGRAALPAAGRQDAGDDRVRRRQGRAPGHRRGLHPARRGHRPRRDARAGHPRAGGGARRSRSWRSTARTCGCWSTRPGGSSSAARWATRA